MTTNGPFKQTAQYRSSAAKIIVIFADQGHGKSCALVDTDWPKDWRVCVLDIDGGFEFARNLWAKRHPPENLLVQPCTNLSELHEGLWTLPDGYNLYAIDTYTSAMKKFKRRVNELEPKAGGIPITNWREVGGKISGLALDYFERWQSEVNRHDAWGVVVCHQKSEGDDPPKYVPALVGQARADVAGTANFVLHIEDQKVIEAGRERWRKVFRTRHVPTCLAKDRSGALDEFEPVDLAQVIRKVEAKRSNQSPPNPKE
jgi:hypothetical protein